MYYKLGSDSYSTAIPKATNAGTYTVWYQAQGAGGNSSEGSVSVTINKAANPLSFTSTQSVSKTFSTSAQTATLTAATDGQGTVSYAISSQKNSSGTEVDYFTLIGTSLTLAESTPTGIYTVSVRATAEGNSNYNSKTVDSTVTVTVGKAGISPTVSMTGYTYGGTKSTPTISGNTDNGAVTYYYNTTNSNSGGTAWTNVANATSLNAGTYYMYAVIGETANYNSATTATVSFTIAQKEVGISWSYTTFTYDRQLHKPTATATGLASGDICTVNVTGEQTNAGTYTATAGSLSNSNYKLPSAGTTTDFTINKASLTIGATDKNITYGDPAPTYEVTCDGLKGGDTVSTTCSCNYTVGIAVGIYTISITHVEDTTIKNNYNITYKDGTLTVGKRTIEISWGETEFTYDGNTHCPTPVVSNKVNSDEISLTVTGGQTDAGTYTAAVTGLTGEKSGNYTLPSDKSTSFVINRKPVTVSGITAEDKTYDGTAEATLDTSSANITGKLASDTLTITATGTFSDADAGTGKTVNITDLALGGASEGNYQLAADGQQSSTTATITKKQITVTAVDRGKTYGDADPELTYLSEELISGNGFTGALSRQSGEDVGTYDITQGTLSAGDNYTITFTGAKFTIGTAVLQISANEQSKTYGDTDPELTYTVSGLKKGETNAVLTGALSRNACEDVGTYPITQGTLSAGNNYQISYTGNDLTITQKVIGITWDNTSFTYDSSPHAPNATATGLVNGDTCNVTVSGEQIEAGEYTATAAELSDTNYKLPSDVTVPFIINKCSTTVTISAADMIYTGGELKPVPTVTADANNGAPIPDTEYSISYSDNINAGTATVTIRNADGGNYIITENSRDFTVIQKSIANDNTESAENKAILPKVEISDIADVMFTGAEHKPAVTLTYNGAALTEGVDYTIRGYVNNTAPGLSTSADAPAVVIEGMGNFKGETKKTFTIKNIPSDYIITNPPDAVGTDSATLCGKVNGYVSSYGDIYLRCGLSEDTSSMTEIGAFSAEDEACKLSADGIFTYALSGLKKNTDYYYQAYLKKDGREIAWGSVVHFKTVKTGDGTIEAEIGNNSGARKDVIITVERGNDIIASSGTLTISEGATGKFTFSSLPDGTYNVVARTLDGKFIETRMITIKGGRSDTAKFTIQKGNLESVVKIKTADTPKVAVEGLPELLTDTEKRNAETGNKGYRVELDAEKIKEKEAGESSGVPDIKGLARKSGRRVDIYLDITLLKTEMTLEDGDVKSETVSNIGGANTNVLEIAVPYQTGRPEISVYRYHDGSAEKLAKLKARPSSDYEDGMFYAGGGYVYIYAKKFSTYAIAYKPAASAEDTDDTADTSTAPAPGNGTGTVSAPEIDDIVTEIALKPVKDSGKGDKDDDGYYLAAVSEAAGDDRPPYEDEPETEAADTSEYIENTDHTVDGETEADPGADRHFILFDLIAVIISLLLGILAVLKRKKWGRAYPLIPAAVALILLILTEHRGSIRFFGSYSIWFACLMILTAGVMAAGAFRKKK